jgi:hypothetical protein
MRGRASFIIQMLTALWPGLTAAQSCTVDFTVRITQGVGPIRPDDEMQGHAEYTMLGRSIRQEGGSTAWLASGEMRLGEEISGRIWTLMTTAEGPTADLMGVYAVEVEGLTFAGVPFEGPMALTLFGRPGTRDDPAPPTRQEDWNALDLRRAFSLQADGHDMLAGDVTALTVECTDQPAN